MADSVDEANHDAKQDANGPNGIDGAKDDIDKLKPPAGATNAQKDTAEKAKEDAEDELDAAIEDINAGRIRSADAHMRKVKKSLRASWPKKNPDPLDDVFKKLAHARHAKALITQPPTPAAAGLMDVVLALFGGALTEAIQQVLREGPLVLPSPAEPRNGDPSEPAKRRTRAAVASRG